MKKYKYGGFWNGTRILIFKILLYEIRCLKTLCDKRQGIG